MSKHRGKVPFNVSGRFLTYKVSSAFKIKGIYLATAQGELYVKLPKSLRYTSMQILESGAWVCVTGHQKFKHGKRKLKALSIARTSPCFDEEKCQNLNAQPSKSIYARNLAVGSEGAKPFVKP